MAESLWADTDAGWVEFGWVEGFHQSTPEQWLECGWTEYGWIEGDDVCVTAAPQWIECGWAEFSPQWISGDEVCAMGTGEITVTYQGGSGGSNKAGKGAKKRRELKQRIGHPVSAIQSRPDWYYEALLPEETQQEQLFTDEVESVIVEQDLPVDSFEQLMEAVDKASGQIEQLFTVRADAQENIRKYKEQIRLRHRRRREEEGILHILMHL